MSILRPFSDFKLMVLTNKIKKSKSSATLSLSTWLEVDETILRASRRALRRIGRQSKSERDMQGGR